MYSSICRFPQMFIGYSQMLARKYISMYADSRTKISADSYITTDRPEMKSKYKYINICKHEYFVDQKAE